MTADLPRTASELRIVIGQLVRRLRLQNTMPLAQVTVLARLDREGPQTTSSLAAGERMRPQSMAQTVQELAAAGLVVRKPDPHDRRRLLVESTARGRKALALDRERREGWLERAIAGELSAEEQAVLRRAVELLERLARSSGS